MLLTLEKSLNPSEPQCPLLSDRGWAMSSAHPPSMWLHLEGLGRDHLWPIYSEGASPWGMPHLIPRRRPTSTLEPTATSLPPERAQGTRSRTCAKYSPRGLVSEYHSGDDGPVSWFPLGKKIQGSPALLGRGEKSSEDVLVCIYNSYRPPRPHILYSLC